MICMITTNELPTKEHTLKCIAVIVKNEGFCTFQFLLLYAYQWKSMKLYKASRIVTKAEYRIMGQICIKLLHYQL